MIEGMYRTFNGSTSIKGFNAFRETAGKSTEIYRCSPRLRRSITRLAWLFVVVLLGASSIVGILSDSGLAIAVLFWTLPAIALYFVFVRFNLTLLKDPGGRLVESLRLANVLTAIRIVLVPPMLVLLFRGELIWGMILYVVAACTDIADGVMARRLGQETALGLVLDPVGDIVSTAAVFAFFWYRDIVPTWLFTVLVIRYVQFFAGLAVLALFGMTPKLSATPAGKAVGVIQAIGIVILLASTIFPGKLPFGAMHGYLVAVLGCAFCWVIVSQTVIGWRAVRERGARTKNRQGSRSMDFGGDLSVLEPSVVFQVVNMSGLTGALKMITIGNVARFYFKEGELIFATIETRRRRIGAFLVEKGLISNPQLERALKEYHAEKNRGKIGNFLIERGFIDRDSFVSAVQDQIKEVVYEALGWNRGEFVFFHRAEPEKEDILLDIKLDYLILEGLKRIDEHAKDE